MEKRRGDVLLLLLTNKITVMITKSEEVYIKRRTDASSYTEINKSDSKWKIGSQFGTGHDVLRGLDEQEERKFLPHIISANTSSLEWEKATKTYWADISRNVPADVGLKLEIGFIYDDAEKAKQGAATEIETRHKFGKPIRLADYILYRYCLVYGKVANSLAVAGKSPKIMFYIYSKASELNQEHDKLELENMALKAYFEVMGDPEKVDDILVIFSKRANMEKLVPSDILQKDTIEKEVLLKRLAIEYSEIFAMIATDKKLSTKSFIERCINAGCLRRVPNTDTIIYGDNDTIGSTIGDAVNFLLDERNSKILNNLNAQMKVQTSAKRDDPEEKVVVETAPTEAPKEAAPVAAAPKPKTSLEPRVEITE